MRRVVVTGVGVATAWGVGNAALGRGLSSGAVAWTELPDLLAQVASGVGGQLDLPRKEFKNWFDPRVLRTSTMTRQTTLGCVACGDLLRDADMLDDPGPHLDKGAYLGSFIVPPAFKKQAAALRILGRRPEGQATGSVIHDGDLALAMKKASAFDFLRALPNMPSSHLSIQTGYQGPACTYLGSDASGMQSIAMGIGAIQSGLAEVMVAGGAFCPFQEVHLLWGLERGLFGADAAGMTPYSTGRTGAVPGEGAALLYIESREHAEARGATILAEVVGFAQRFATPGEDDVGVRSEALATACAGATPDWVGVDAMGHPELDLLESQAYADAFGDAPLAAVSATPLVGFSGPANGPVNLVSALLAARGEFEPARNAGNDPACATLGAATARAGRTGAGALALGSTFSLDGVHSAVALRVEG